MISIVYYFLGTNRHSTKKLSFFVGVLFSVLFGGCFVATAEETITASGHQGSFTADLSHKILKNAYAQMGIKLMVHYFPNKRSLLQSNSGQINSELGRIASIGKRYQNLEMVSPPLFELKGIAFALNYAPETDLDRYESIGIIRGVKWASELTKGRNPVIAENTHQLFQLLNAGRLDIILSSYLAGNILLKKHPDLFKDIKQSKPLARFPIHHFLHKSKGHLATPLGSILHRMKNKGDIEKLTSGFLAEVGSE